MLPKNIKLLPLSPYSPELNPMENVWDYLCQDKLCSTVWDSCEETVVTCKTAWNWLSPIPLRADYDASQVRLAAKRSKDSAQAGVCWHWRRSIRVPAGARRRQSAA